MRSRKGRGAAETRKLGWTSAAASLPGDGRAHRAFPGRVAVPAVRVAPRLLVPGARRALAARGRGVSRRWRGDYGSRRRPMGRKA